MGRETDKIETFVLEIVGVEDTVAYDVYLQLPVKAMGWVIASYLSMLRATRT